MPRLRPTPYTLRLASLLRQALTTQDLATAAASVGISVRRARSLLALDPPVTFPSPEERARRQVVIHGVAL